MTDETPPSPSPKTKRAVLKLTEQQHDLLRWTVLPQHKSSWQDMLFEATNLWLNSKGLPPLKDDPE